MQSRAQTIRIVPSVLDRLFDDEPQSEQDPQLTFRQGLAQLRHSVARDLEGLLNTRADYQPDLALYPELACSSITYGLPDFSNLSPASEADRNQVRQQITAAISRFEPRLKNVEVILVQRDDTQQFGFHIEALLQVDPVPEPVVFDAVLEVSTQLYRIRHP